MKKYFLYLFIISVLFSCRKEISLDFPQVPKKLVVQGSIEPGFPPYMILTRNQGYFETIDSSTYNNLFVSDAEITVFKLGGNEIIDSIELFQQFFVEPYHPVVLGGFFSIADNHPMPCNFQSSMIQVD